MKFSKILVSAALLAFATTWISAQDFDSFDDFGSSSGFDDFGDDSSSSGPEFSIGGEAGFETRAWINTEGVKDFKKGHYDWDDVWSYLYNTNIDSNAYLNLDLSYSGSYSDMEAKLKIDQGSIKEYPEDVIEEITARGYFCNGTLQVEGGKMKVVWGKGDKFHVLDNFNANDYTDFVFPDYIDRRLAEPMFRIIYSSPTSANIKLEGIFTPTMTADRFASSGTLLPHTMSKLTNQVTSTVTSQLATKFAAVSPAYMALYNAQNSTLPPVAKEAAIAKANTAYSLAVADYLSYLNFANDLNANPDLLYEDTHTIKFCQAGARLTGTLASIDWGFSYYYGHNKQPSARLDGTINANLAATFAEKAGGSSAATLAAYGANALPKLSYDQLQVFGFEFATVLWKFNTRGEFAYNMTPDISGRDPWIHNNSIAWLGGFDIDIPIHNLNINIQETGKYVLNNGKINDRNVFAIIGDNYDVDYNSDGYYHINKLIVNVSDKFLHEKLVTEVSAIWGIENQECVIMPKIEYNVKDGLTFVLRGAYIYSKNENGEFYNFTADNPKDYNKAFAQFNVKYSF